VRGEAYAASVEPSPAAARTPPRPPRPPAPPTTGDPGGQPGQPPRQTPAPPRAGIRQFLLDVVAELRRTTWTTNTLLRNAAVVVLAVVALVAFVAIADVVTGRLVTTLFD